MIISTDVESAFDQIQYAFMIRMINGMCIEGAHFSIIKGMYDKITHDIILKRSKTEAFSLRSETTRMPTVLLIINIVPELYPE